MGLYCVSVEVEICSAYRASDQDRILLRVLSAVQTLAQNARRILHATNTVLPADACLELTATAAVSNNI